MSKVSVFKFSLGSDSTKTCEIVNSYLISRGFNYISEKNAYYTGNGLENSKKDNAKLFGTAVAVGGVTGGNFIPVKEGHELGFEYYIEGGFLIIKAFLFNKVMGSKLFIHSLFNSSVPAANYYNDLKNNLFKKLEENNIILQSKEVLKIKDGKEGKYALFLVLIYTLVIIFAVAVILIFMG